MYARLVQFNRKSDKTKHGMCTKPYMAKKCNTCTAMVFGVMFIPYYQNGPALKLTQHTMIDLDLTILDGRTCKKFNVKPRPIALNIRGIPSSSYSNYHDLMSYPFIN